MDITNLLIAKLVCGFHKYRPVFWQSRPQSLMIDFFRLKNSKFAV